MKQYLKINEAIAKRSGAMEAETISKNWASLKSQMSKRNIMRKFLLFTVFYINMASMMAQDIITQKNGDEIQAIVQEIGDVEVKYKRFDNPNGPNYTLKKSGIIKIQYANGSSDVFENKTVPIMVDFTPMPALTDQVFKKML